MELSTRLQMNADLVPTGARVADIGCDHGYGAIYLAENKQCPRVIAMDINRGPLEIAGKNIKKAGLTKEIECRRSDGMEQLEPGEVDTLMIAGMGGMLVCQILQNKPAVLTKIRTLILQVQSDWEILRRLLPQIGFRIDKESVCQDGGKYYIAIRAVQGKDQKPYTDAEYAYGRILPEEKNVCYREYLVKEKEKKQQILKKLERNSSHCVMARIEELTHKLNQINETLKTMSGGENDYNNT